MSKRQGKKSDLVVKDEDDPYRLDPISQRQKLVLSTWAMLVLHAFHMFFTKKMIWYSSSSLSIRIDFSIRATSTPTYNLDPSLSPSHIGCSQMQQVSFFLSMQPAFKFDWISTNQHLYFVLTHNFYIRCPFLM